MSDTTPATNARVSRCGNAWCGGLHCDVCGGPATAEGHPECIERAAREEVEAAERERLTNLHRAAGVCWRCAGDGCHRCKQTGATCPDGETITVHGETIHCGGTGSAHGVRMAGWYDHVGFDSEGRAVASWRSAIGQPTRTGATDE